MGTNKRRYSNEDFARRGDALVESRVRPNLTAADEDKYGDLTLKDAWGIPAIRVTYKDHADDLATSSFLQDRAHTYNEKFTVKIRKLDGSFATICEGSAMLSV